METFVGLDVSLGETSVCILDKDGTRIFEGKVASEPAPIARLIRKRAPGVVRVGLESGPTSVWLTHALTAEGLPVVCLDARHAQAVLSVQINKSDRGDARGLAEMIRVGWFKAVQVKSLNAHERKALLIARHQLVDMRVRIDNQLRGILKTFGLVIGKCGRGQIGQRAQELSKGQPGIDGVVASMVAVRDSLLEQIIVCDRAIRRLAKKDDTARRLMTVPGVGPVVALAYISVIDDPKRFTHARDVGAYLGLTPKRYQSGEVGHCHVNSFLSIGRRLWPFNAKSCCLFDVGLLAPDSERLHSFCSILVCCHAVPAWMEMPMDESMSRKELLRLAL